jgi:hypothetical protein
MKPKCKLVGEDGSAFAIIGRVSQALRRAGQGAKVEGFQKRATSGDYNNLLAVAMEYVDEPGARVCCGTPEGEEAGCAECDGRPEIYE